MGEGKEFENQGTLAPCPSSADGHHRLNYSCHCNLCRHTTTVTTIT